MSDEFDEHEAAEQAAEDQFPMGWTDIGVTEESVLEYSRRTTEEFVEKMKPLIEAFKSATISLDTANTKLAAWKRAMLEEIYHVPAHRRQVMLD